MSRKTARVTPSTRFRLAALAHICLAFAPANSAEVTAAVEQIAVTEIKPLLILAAERGEAHGILGGAGADYVRRRFDTTTPIEIDVRRLHRLPQPGCGRLEVTTHQRDVMESGSRHDQTLTYQVSFCSDGQFPEKR